MKLNWIFFGGGGAKQKSSMGGVGILIFLELYINRIHIHNKGETKLHLKRDLVLSVSGDHEG